MFAPGSMLGSATLLVLTTIVNAQTVRNCVTLYDSVPGMGGWRAVVDVDGEQGTAVSIDLVATMEIFEPRAGNEPSFTRSGCTKITLETSIVVTLGENGDCVLVDHFPAWTVTASSDSPLWFANHNYWTDCHFGPLDADVWADAVRNAWEVGDTYTFGNGVPLAWDTFQPLFAGDGMFGWLGTWGQWSTNSCNNGRRLYSNVASLVPVEPDSRRVNMPSDFFGAVTWDARFVYAVIPTGGVFAWSVNNDGVSPWMTVGRIQIESCNYPVRKYSACAADKCDWWQGAAGPGGPPGGGSTGGPQLPGNPVQPPTLPIEEPVVWDDECLECPLLAQVVRNTAPLRYGVQTLVDQGHEMTWILENIYQVLAAQAGEEGDDAQAPGTHEFNDQDFDELEAGRLSLAGGEGGGGVAPLSSMTESVENEVGVDMPSLFSNDPDPETEFSVTFDLSEIDGNLPTWTFHVDLSLYELIRVPMQWFILTGTFIWGFLMVFEEFRRY